MLVDDEGDITFTLRTILEKGGFEVVSHNDPILALQSFKPHYYDLLVHDVRMPQLNEFELYQQLRKKDSRVKVCFLTLLPTLWNMNNIRRMYFPNQTKGILLQNQFHKMGW